MPALGQDTIVIAEYPSEKAGESVAWLDTDREIREGYADLVSFTIAYATIGEKGAHYSFRIAEDGEKLTSNQNNWGFENSTELRAVVADEELLEVVPLRIPEFMGFPKKGRDWSKIGTGLYQESGLGIDVDKGEWVIGGEQIVRAIHRHLAAEKIDHIYEPVYYNLAMMADPSSLLADPEMRDRTNDLVNAGRGYIDTIDEIILTDNIMKKNLTVFADVDAEDIPAVFSSSRRIVHDLEVQLQDIVSEMPVGKWFAPVGVRPWGRTWPYMDPMLGGEDGFSRELMALKARNVHPADYELVRELKELQSRREHAMKLCERLGELARKETESAESQDTLS